jgi:hypothetical protein
MRTHSRHVGLALALLAWVVAGTEAAAWPKFAPLKGGSSVKVPLNVLDLLPLLDKWTEKDSTVETRAVAARFQEEFKAVVAKETVEVTKTAASRNWRGTVAVRVTVPCEVHFTIDWEKLRPEDVRVDLAKKTLKIRLPVPEPSFAEPKTTESRTCTEYGACRFGLFDSNTGLQLENVLLKEDWVAAAKAEAAQNVESARQMARQKLIEFFKWRGIDAEIE